MKLSIIIPTYNSGSTIESCLNSIVQQSFKDFEVWVIDGKSTDNTVQIVNGFIAKHSYIHLISESDKGIYDAMNKGIHHAKGEWVYFIGCDDVLYDAKTLTLLFEDQKKEIEHFDIVYGNVLFKEVNVHSNYQENFGLMDFMDTNINHQSMFYRKTVFSKVGMYSLEYPIYSDWEFNVRCFFLSQCRIRYVRNIIAIFSLEGASNKKTDSWMLIKDQVIFSFLKHKPLLLKLIFFNRRNNQIGIINKLKYYSGAFLIKILERTSLQKDI